MRNIGRREFVVNGAVAGAALAGWPAKVRVRQAPSELVLANDRIAAAWSVADGAFRAVRVSDPAGGGTLALPADAFTLTLGDGTVLRSSALALAGSPEEERLAPSSRASRAVERLPGRAIRVRLRDPGRGLSVTWRGVLRDGSHYIRQEVTLESERGDLPVQDIRLFDLDLPDAAVAGAVKGSPVVAGRWFAGFEHPLSDSAVNGSRVTASLARELPLRAGTRFTVSSVIGCTGAGQLRRDFLAYLERERAHPYRPFLHYNSWYDIGYFSKYDEAQALAAIRGFGDQLHDRRGVTLDSFLFDDGWDDPTTLWHFHSGFPRGFQQVARECARYGARPGIWMSPWGGYGKPREERLAAGKAQGFETNEGGFELSGPKYFDRFRSVCREMIRKYGVNQFKFDGTGNASHVFPGSAFDSDFDAMLALIADLRREEPDLYVNLTTGTYPSPFFLTSCDSIWRGGDDHDFAGVGSFRQRWITYRDADTHSGIVRQGPLFPLNSLMLHGMIYARHAHDLDTDPGSDFASEVRAYFGTGTQLQEMYITPALLTPGNWDAIAESAIWARRNAATLVDTHWVGGDPGALEPYGHAAWGAGKGILVLRNPKDAPQTLALDVAQALELPDGAPRTFRLASPFEQDGVAPVEVRAGESHAFDLAPFQVLTLETT